MTTKLTSTTGTVKGIAECKAFIKMTEANFNLVHVESSKIQIEGYLQYTLLTNNEIRIYK